MAKGRKTGGRKRGSVNRVTSEAREAAELLVDDVIYRRKLLADFRARRVGAPIEQMLWYYAKGKPKEMLEHAFPDGVPVSVVEWVVSHVKPQD
jgi:hypothetical protein